MKAGKLAEIFSSMNPNDEVWANYITKDDVEEAFRQQELTDENDNLIETEVFVTNNAVETIGSYLDNNDHLWETFNDAFGDYCNELLEKLFQEAKEDKELWDTEGVTDESERVIA